MSRGSIDGFLCSLAYSLLDCSFTSTVSLERPAAEIAFPLFPVYMILLMCAGQNSLFLLCIPSIRRL